MEDKNGVTQLPETALIGLLETQLGGQSTEFESDLRKLNEYYAGSVLPDLISKYQMGMSEEEARRIASEDTRKIRDDAIDRIVAIYEKQMNSYEGILSNVEDELRDRVKLISKADPKNVQEVAAGQLSR
jgi:hypothetical protein